MVKNIIECIKQAVEEYGSKTAFMDFNNTITFSELNSHAMSIGSALLKLDKNRPIAVVCGRSIKMIDAIFGTIFSGHCYAPLDATTPLERLKSIFTSLNPVGLLIDIETKNILGDFLEELLGEDISVFEVESIIHHNKIMNELESIQSSVSLIDPLYIIYTSGSSGRPKGVITSHQSLIYYLDGYAEVMNINNGDVLGNQSPLDYIAAIRDIFLPICTGCTSVIIPKEYFMQPERLFQYMNEKNVSCIGWSVSAFTVLQSLGAFDDIQLNTVKKVCFSGSVMPTKCLKLFQEKLPDALFVNQYGPTEATASCMYYVIDHVFDDGESLPIGVPYKHYSITLLNEKDEEIPTGEVGEICVTGPILALGYYNDIERTSQAFKLSYKRGYLERIYHTGDYGRIRTDGNMEFHGRKDRQIKHLGHRVELDEIEYAANQLTGVIESAAIYSKDIDKIYLSYCGEIDEKALTVALRGKLPSFMVPRKVRKLNGLPKLANGKIDYKSLEGGTEK